MKLRNKKTDEIVEIFKIGLVWNRLGCPADIGQYESLAELNEDWEDCEPTEPLIKDQKIRKAVRAWAEANGASRAYIVDLGMLRDESSGNEIKFNGEPFVGWLTSLKTITELCGEEEE